MTGIIDFTVKCSCGRVHYHSLENKVTDDSGVVDTKEITTTTVLTCECGQTHSVSIHDRGYN